MGVRVARRVVVVGLDGFDPKIVEPLLAAVRFPSSPACATKADTLRCGRPIRPRPPLRGPRSPPARTRGGTESSTSSVAIHNVPARFLAEPIRAEKRRSCRRGRSICAGERRCGRCCRRPAFRRSMLRCPCTFPPDDVRGRMLSGMGVPDLRGGLGTSARSTRRNGRHARRERAGAYTSPSIPAARANAPHRTAESLRARGLSTEIVLEPEPAARRVTIRSEGQPKALEVAEGEWSDWLKVKFKTGLLQSVRGMVRFHLVRLEPVFELYASPVNFDPETPLFPISAPPQYARELAAQVGTFYTTGMVEDHGGLNNGRFDEEAYLDQCDGVLRERERDDGSRAGPSSRGAASSACSTRPTAFSTCSGDSASPGIRPIAATASELDTGASIEDTTGPAMPSSAGDGARRRRHAVHRAERSRRSTASSAASTSTRGCTSTDCSRSSRACDPGEEAGDFLLQRGLGRTQGLRARPRQRLPEPEGTRRRRASSIPTTSARFEAAIAGGLTGLRGPRARRRRRSKRASRASQVYAGAYADESPDLVVQFAAGYRVVVGDRARRRPGGASSRTTCKKWGGDHIIDPSPGSRRAVHEPAVPRRGRRPARHGADDSRRARRAARTRPWKEQSLLP